MSEPTPAIGVMSPADLDRAIDYMESRGVDVSRVEGDIVEG